MISSSRSAWSFSYFCKLFQLTLSHLGGADSVPPWETFLNNSKTAQDIEMKIFKFNLTPMGVILHMMTILINLRCCHGNLLLWMCRGIEKWRNLYISQDIGLILFKFGAEGYFWILNPKSTIKFYTTSFWRQNDVKVEYQYITCRKMHMTSYDVTFCPIVLKTSIYFLLMTDYHHKQIWFNLDQGKQNYGGGAESAPQVENVLNRPGEIGLR